MKQIFLLIFLFAFSFCLGSVGYMAYFTYGSCSSEEGEVTFDVPPGSGFYSLIPKLKQLGFVCADRRLRYLSRATGYQNEVKIGEYLLSTRMSPMNILKTLSSGKSIQRSLTIAEGLNAFEVAEIFERANITSSQNFISLCFNKSFIRRHLGSRVDSCEGYLFPDTYFVTKYMGYQEIMVNMFNRFNEAYASLGAREILKGLGLNKEELITLASIIEKETGAHEERAIVSSVYHNRLRKKMRLQADPTTLYGKMVGSGHIEISITRSDLKAVNAYNTYAMRGLPRGPIANPGLESMRAALHPDLTEYLYFVSRNDGTHVFSETYESHNRAVIKHQKDPRARRGKSWRDLKKRHSTQVQ